MSISDDGTTIADDGTIIDDGRRSRGSEGATGESLSISESEARLGRCWTPDLPAATANDGKPLDMKLEMDYICIGRPRGGGGLTCSALSTLGKKCRQRC